jgi:hypothetical protein
MNQQVYPIDLLIHITSKLLSMAIAMKKPSIALLGAIKTGFPEPTCEIICTPLFIR